MVKVMTLLEQLGAATEGGIELDEKIATALFGPPKYAVLPGGQRSKMPLWRCRDILGDDNMLLSNLVPPWSTSLDAGTTLYKVRPNTIPSNPLKNCISALMTQPAIAKTT